MPKPTLIEVAKSVLAAFIGVQSTENREKDFSQGSLKMYIAGGVIFTILFVSALVFIVSAVIG